MTTFPQLTHAEWVRSHRAPGGAYALTHREYLGLHRIRARLLRGPRLSEAEQRALGRLMHRLIEPPEPCYGAVRKPLVIAGREEQS
jgi:hypothetical protein